MEWRIELEAEGHVVRVTTSGLFLLRDQERMFGELARHPVFTPGSPVLFDNRRLDLSGSNADIMRTSVAIVQRFLHDQRVDRIAGLVEGELNFGMGRQFEILTEVTGGHGFRLFTNEELALGWLRGEWA